VKRINRHCSSVFRRGFTLLEILLVLALIGSMAGLFVMSLESMVRSSPGDSLEGAFWSALRQAREAAVHTRRTQAISFDAERLEFIIEGGVTLKTAAVNTDGLGDTSKIEAVFTQVLPSNSFTLVRGRLVTEREIPTMLVFADGTCQPVTIEFRFPGGTKRLTIDPWTCAELLDPDAEGRR
jgi:general secretion pathway protein H